MFCGRKTGGNKIVEKEMKRERDGRLFREKNIEALRKQFPPQNPVHNSFPPGMLLIPLFYVTPSPIGSLAAPYRFSFSLHKHPHFPSRIIRLPQRWI
jgi:hypothetical protein